MANKKSSKHTRRDFCVNGLAFTCYAQLPNWENMTNVEEQVETEEPEEENKKFLNDQIITYLGNKRGLLNFIGKGLDVAIERLGRRKLVTSDLFAGSGIVSRYLKRFSSELYSNDFEHYSAYINSCYLTNKSTVDMSLLGKTLKDLKKGIKANWTPGFITEMYAPKDDNNIQEGERVFFTRRNAIYIDTARQAIGKLDAVLQPYFLAPLLYEASVHNNTSGVFKGFYKNKAGRGQFGGEGRNALKRILGEIELQLPVFSFFECPYHVTQLDAAKAVSQLPGNLDFCYMDPPYNQHPYGANYFMLNLILENKKPAAVSKVSGIPLDWQRSDYNKNHRAREALFSVVKECPAKFILISYNSEGFITYEEFVSFLKTLGTVTKLETDYNTYRGSRNLNKRALKVKEFLFLLERK